MSKALGVAGSRDGWNNSNPGYENNTRVGPGKYSGETDPNRHCDRPTRAGRMKCKQCFHYYKVAKGQCANCGAPHPTDVPAPIPASTPPGAAATTE